MTASFDRKELLASLVELERLARERGRPASQERVPISRNHAIQRDSLQIKNVEHVLAGRPLRTFPEHALAAIPSDQLRVGLDAILASEKSRASADPARVEDTAQFTPRPGPDWPPRSGWPFLVAPASVIAIALLVCGAGYEAWSRFASVEPPALPPIQKDYAVAEARADIVQAAAEPTATPTPAPEKPLAATEERVSQGGTQTTPAAPAAEITRPERKVKKASADKSRTRERLTEHHAKPKPSTAATGRTAPRTAAPENTNDEPTVISDARRVTQTIAGVFNGWGGSQDRR